MRQYAAFKRRHPDCVLLFRIGDFYEMFDDDAVTVSRALGLTLTQRTEGVPMAGVPFHQLENYLRRLIRQGFRVAVCDQVEDAKEAKGIVARAVTRVVTPGTLVDESLLDDAAPSRLGAAAFVGEGEEAPAAAAVVELSTGSFELLSAPGGALADELTRRGVTELLYAASADPGGPPPARMQRVLSAMGLPGVGRPAWHFRALEGREVVLEQFGASTLAGFGLADDDPALGAAGALLRYLRETQATDPDAPAEPGRTRPTLAHLRPPRREDPADWCVVDATSLRALEVERPIRAVAPGVEAGSGGAGDGSLLGLFLGVSGQGCRTAMGKRLLREWLCRPLARLESIRARQAGVAVLVEDRRTAAALAAALDGIQDVPRISARIALRRATPRDVVGLGRALGRLAGLREAIVGAAALARERAELDAVTPVLAPVGERIARLCVETPPAHLRDGGLIRDGVDPALDEARLLQTDAAAWLAAYQGELVARHALPGIKVGYNKVFGYYIELTAAQARAAPDAFSRVQTLKNAERYTTPELRDFERRVTTARARAVERERELFEALCDQAAAALDALHRFADAAARLDALGGLADRAVRGRWVRPVIIEEPRLSIRGGRHPVLEEVLGSGFVPNDIDLGAGGPPGDWTEPGAARAGDGGSGADAADAGVSGDASAGARLALITGPNMAGKSTFIRQTALIALLAHAGSFVPADRATVGLVDRIFTRVGAEDALHAGQSTFMVEMIETARILHHATARSLVILDEIGRGTSTLDGLSLAWAIAEHLASGGPGRADGGGAPRTLFATHYHELTELEERLPGRVRNLHVAVREWGEEIVFLHRILPGRSDRSYGIHVARLAGLPRSVTQRAREVLESLAVHHHGPAGAGGGAPAREPGAPPDDGQFRLFTEYLPHPALDRLREVKLDALTPLEAFDELRRLRALLERGGE